MRTFDKILLFVMVSLASVQLTVGQLPLFLQRFMPIKHSLLGSGSSPYTSSIGSASSLFSRPYSSPSYGPHSSIFGSAPFGSASSLSFAAPTSPTFGAHTSGSFGGFGRPLGTYSSLSQPSGGYGGLSLPSQSFGGSSGGFGFASPSFGSSSSLFGSSPSFLPASMLHAAASYSSPSFGGLSGPKFGSSDLSSSSLGSSSLMDFGSSSSFDGLGSFDQSELLDDYPGFSSAGFAKDLNLAASQSYKVQAHPSYGSEYLFLRRDGDKN